MPEPKLLPIERLVAHTVSTLPDSLSRRRELLNALGFALTHDQAVADGNGDAARIERLRREVAELLHHLNQHDIMQRELALGLTT